MAEILKTAGIHIDTQMYNLKDTGIREVATVDLIFYIDEILIFHYERQVTCRWPM